MQALLTLVLAGPLLEDQLEEGHVPMYGHEVYSPVPQARAPVAPPPVRSETVWTPVEPVEPVEAIVESDEFDGFDDNEEPWYPVIEAVDEPAPVAVVATVEPEPPVVLAAEKPGPTASIRHNEGSYDQGFARGERDAAPSAISFLGGLGAGAVLPVCGCVGAGVIAGVIGVEGPEPGDWENGSADYQEGYVAGWTASTRKQRVVYTLMGGLVGTTVTVVVLSAL